MTLTKMANKNDKLVPMKIILEVKIKQNRADCGSNVDTANAEDSKYAEAQQFSEGKLST